MNVPMNRPDSGIEYELSRTFPVSPEVLFDALTNAEVLRRIWGVQKIDVDARVGGHAAATFLADGVDWSFTITYTELARDAGRLRWVARFRSFQSRETRGTMLLRRADQGTVLTLRMQNFESPEERDANRQAWERGLTILDDAVSE